MERGVYNSENIFHKRLTDNSPVFRRIADDNAKDKHPGGQTLRRNLSILKANYVSAADIPETSDSRNTSKSRKSPLKSKKNSSPFIKEINEKEVTLIEIQYFLTSLF